MVFRNGKVLCDDFRFRDVDVLVKDGIIARIGENLTDDEVVDLDGAYLLPGLIDEHFHGADGIAVNGCDSDGILKIAAFEAKNGITTIVPTLGSRPDEALYTAVKAVSEAMKAPVVGSRIYGIHLEGPFLSNAHRGAHKTELLQLPTPEKLKRYMDHAPGTVKVLTIAPELEGAMETIRYAVDNGVVVEIGHTGADYDTTIAAIDAGATVSTHTFNGMIGLNHRSPGVLGAVLTDDRVHCEVMGDFGHVAPAIVKLIYRAKGDCRVNFVSDSTAMAGYPDGRYEVEGGVNIIENGLSRLESGTINGSAATVLLGVQNALKIDIPLESAVKMASYNPAVSLGIDKECGSISVGKRADLFVADADVHPLATYVGGQKVYSV